jgi:glycosyltransferase involved in cell wall biosynthesis
MVHKNHRLVVEAIGLLARRGCHVTVVSTGHHWDYRHPKHYAQLQSRIAELDIESSYLRLGVVPFTDMIGLMKESICVVNPSRFEGWSTTVEEAKALGKFVLLSDIPVHREQSPRYCAFFDVDDVEGLADLMWARWQQAADQGDRVPETEIAAAHRENRAAFAKRYRKIVEQALAR